MNLNIQTWYTERQMSFCPKHFISVKIPLTDEKKFWIIDKLSGRYFIGEITSTAFLFADFDEYPSFEDPQEAILFQLTWS